MVLDGKSSQEYRVNAGVSQISILGPTLFLHALMTFMMLLSVMLLTIHFFIRPIFCLSLNFLNIILEIRLRFS